MSLLRDVKHAEEGSAITVMIVIIFPPIFMAMTALMIWLGQAALAQQVQFQCTRLAAEAVVLATNREAVRVAPVGVTQTQRDAAQEAYGQTMCGQGGYYLSRGTWSIDLIENPGIGVYSVTASQTYMNTKWDWTWLPAVDISSTRTASAYQYE